MVTIKDVAKLAGVSISTASRAMHDNPSISEATKKKVKQAMEKLKYTPNFSAQNLVNQKTNIVGVILPYRQNDVGSNPFFIQIIQGIAEICNAHGYVLTVASGQDSEELLNNVKMLVNQGKVTSFIFAYSIADDPIREYIRHQSQLNYVVIGTPYDVIDKDIYYVDNDNIKAGSDATEYMYKKGYRKIAFVYSDLMEIVQSDRYLGYQRIMRIHGLSEYTLRLKAGNSLENERIFKEFYEQNQDIEGFVTCDDLMGLEVQRLSRSNVGIIGFNNSVFAKIAKPSLTSVEIFPHFLGIEAAALAINKDDQLLKINTNAITVPHNIIERESTACSLEKIC